MSDSTLDRAVAYRSSVACDCWGRRRFLRHGARHGIWYLDATGFDQPAEDPPPENPDARAHVLEIFRASGRFTPIELATLEALVVDRLTIDEIAARDRCSRQAILARVIGNSRGQGGILKKTRRLLLCEGPPP